MLVMESSGSTFTDLICVQIFISFNAALETVIIIIVFIYVHMYICIYGTIYIYIYI